MKEYETIFSKILDVFSHQGFGQNCLPLRNILYFFLRLCKNLIPCSLGVKGSGPLGIISPFRNFMS